MPSESVVAPEFEIGRGGAVRLAADRSAVCQHSAEQRLLDAVTEACARVSYPDLTVEDLLAGAGVSRATFYQYFSNVEDCFLAAYRGTRVRWWRLSSPRRIASTPSWQRSMPSSIWQSTGRM